MRALVTAGLMLTAAATAAASWGTVVYDHDTLVRQRLECPPRGPHPDQGCDQCLPYTYSPLFVWSRIFCGDATTDWCPLRWVDCDVCNGSCAIIYQKGRFRWVSVLGDLDPVHAAIESCRQWRWQTYGEGANGPVPGAYLYGEEFSWIPPHERGYSNLPEDPVYRAEIAAYTGPHALDLESAWRHRIGLFTVMVDAAQTSADRAHYARAANLCAWYSLYRFAPPEEVMPLLAAAGFPAVISSADWDDLETIQEVTCGETLFADCWDPVEPATWGRIKNLYRDH